MLNQRRPPPHRMAWQPDRAPAGCRLYAPVRPANWSSANAQGNVRVPTVLDHSPYRHHAAAKDAALTWVRGANGWEVGPFSTSSYLECENINPQIMGAAYPCWMAVMASTTSTPAANVFSQARLTGGGDAYLQITSSTSATYGLTGGVAATAVGTGLTLHDGRMHLYLGVSRSAADHALYVDGRPAGTSATNVGAFPTTGGAPRVCVGVYGSDSQYGPFTGTVAWFGMGNGGVPDPLALAFDLLSGRFSAVRPRPGPALTSSPAATVYHAGGAVSASGGPTYYAF